MKPLEEKEREQTVEEFVSNNRQAFLEVFEQIKKVVTEFIKNVKQALMNIGLVKDYAPPDQSKMEKFLEQKKNHEPFYRSVGKKKPWE